MKKANISNYLDFYSGTYMTLGTLYSIMGIFAFIDLPVNYFGWSLGGNALLVCIIIDAITIAYIIFSIVLAYALPKRTTPVKMSGCYLLSGIALSSMTIYFFLLSILMSEFSGPNYVSDISMFIVLLLFIALYFIKILSSIRNDSYNKNIKKRIGKSNVMIFALFGSSMGYALARVFLSTIDQNSAILIACIGTLFISCLSSCGLSNFLKCYYIKKYSLKDPVQITMDELKMMKK